MMNLFLFFYHNNVHFLVLHFVLVIKKVLYPDRMPNRKTLNKRKQREAVLHKHLLSMWNKSKEPKYLRKVQEIWKIPLRWYSRKEPWWEWLNRLIITNNFWLKERIVEIMQMHIDMIDRHNNSKTTKRQRRIELVFERMLNTFMLTISETERWKFILVAFIHYYLVSYYKHQIKFESGCFLYQSYYSDEIRAL